MLRIHLRAVAGLVLLTATALAGPPDALHGKRFHKLLVRKGEPLDAALAAHARLLAGYEAFDLFEVPAGAVETLPAARRQAALAHGEMDLLKLKAGVFDTQLETEAAGVRPELRERPGPARSSLMLVQLVGPVQDRWLAELRAAGASVVHAIPENGYLVWAPPEAARRLHDMAAERRFLQYAAAYHPQYKLSPRLLDPVGGGLRTSGSLVVSVQRYAAPGTAASRSSTLALAEEVLVPWTPLLGYENARLRVQAERLVALAHQPDIVWIAPWREPVLYDEVQSQILAGALRRDGKRPTGPGYLAWLESLGLSTDAADYPVLAIVDDGIGNGRIFSGDPTLHVRGLGTLQTRMAFNQSCTGDGAEGVGGHGHINASIAAGYDERAGAPFQDLRGFQRGLGLNPFGRVAGLRIFDDVGLYNISQCGGSDAALIDRAWQLGTRISSNSWGADVGGDYDASAQAYDAGTRDAQPQTGGHQQMLFLFAAGNAGAGARTVGSPGSAKNVLTVGASENDRPDGTDGCGIGPEGADNAMDVIGFSSRGPAEGDRFKPELVAPGTHVQGTASTTVSFDGSGVCDRIWPQGQTVFARSSGTSHSTPAVAGIASLYHHWLSTRFLAAPPSPALLKAYLLAHLRYLDGKDAGDDLPSNAQGYGMPDMSAGFDQAARILVDQSHVFDQSGQAWSLEGSVVDPSRPLRIVLAWTDAPGSLSGAPQVNDLDLEVVVGGVRYQGNRFEGAFSVPSTQPDRFNNVEAVFLPAGASGELLVRVVAANIAGDGVPGVGDATDQDFALVVYNGQETPGFRMHLEPRSLSLCGSGELSVPLSLEPVKGFDTPVKLAVENLPAGVQASFEPPVVTLPGTSMLSLTADGVLPSAYTLRVVGSAGDVLKGQSLELNLHGALASPRQQTPYPQATNVNPSAQLVWDALNGASDYRVQVATDEAFSQLVVDRTLAGTTLKTPKLEPATAYLWRLQGRNTCGDGPFSITRQFTTAVISTAAFACAQRLPLEIPDADPAGIECTLEAPAGFQLQDVTLDVVIRHPFRGDLQLDLIAPDGTIVRLKSIDGADSAPDVLGNYDQTLEPEGPGAMSDFDERAAGGAWTLKVSDQFSRDVGQLVSAKLNLTGFIEGSEPVPVVGWLGGALLLLLTGRMLGPRGRKKP
jgi:subtilisin-like proprotein convertase family protein